MKKSLTLILFIVALAALLFYNTTLRQREVVILSTNDMHANIDNFAALATAVGQCRDTVETLLVDAGDRWTGNAFVDLAESRLPIIELMNSVGYNVATLGNHEFDAGAAVLQNAVDYADFTTICANMQSSNADLKTLAPTAIIKTKCGIKIGFVGVVTNYDNGHPDGSEEVFKGLEFIDPMQAAETAVAECEACDVKVLLSHMADDKDMIFASRFEDYHLIIGGHSHMIVDTLVGKTVIGQTGRKLKNVGATRIKLKGRKIISIEYENIPLSNYSKDSVTLSMVEKIESNPALKVKVGELSAPTNLIGFANLETKLIAQATSSQIGFYHYGGIRIAEYPAGDVSLLTLYNLEPFESKVHTIIMTPAQMRKMIVTKFNDTKNLKESHRIDLFSTTPYDIVVDSAGEAVTVRFPKLVEGKKYRVALSDYVGKKYEAIEGDNHTEQNILVVDILLKHFREHGVVVPDNVAKQRIVKR